MSKTLAACFSASGITKALSERLAKAAEADLFEIVPEEPYSDADLDWRDKKSRSTIEMEDRSSRPAIANKVENMDEYDTVYIGFPIWWYREPSIIDTFMESYDFTGKTVIPFATSGGSDIKDTYKNLQELAPKANVKVGKRFPDDVTVEELKEWIKEI